MSIPTPSLSHLTAADFRCVYEPAEDTFVLLDALEQDQDALRGEAPFRSYPDAQAQLTRSKAKRPRLCVELGSGSGCVSTFIGKILGSHSTAILSIDINPRAIDCTKRTGQANEVHLEPVLANMLSSMRTRTTRTDKTEKHNEGSGTIDLLVFNPPYVPTPEEEEANAQSTGDISGAWAGGLTGTRLVDELIDGLSTSSDSPGTQAGIEHHLSPGAAFYLVAIRQNDPPALVKRLQARGLEAEVVLQRRAGREHLFVIRALNSNSMHAS
ncbi:S-adenosylmethionine-dependent methyltransferase [Tilletia horrida]|uniref:S-adenosylmethionine-dependent methyltransferase n=1 Tax=Tilletia horrida TaxID=155126 RepID=A0AAN6GVU2_9BASI|nr:S-adenosylmethionine-dependent methyltransferase [Tilletia horrida]KAK0568510.1 S-adenosylmethionine-dependent methyltransferase [Tilletia horrida]